MLKKRHRRYLVGRRAELELFLSALEDTDGLFHVLHISGPGGIGKSELLDSYAEVARAARCEVVQIDGRELPATPAAVADAVGAQLGLDSNDEPIDARRHPRVVMLVDGYEHLRLLDAWFRDSLLRRLPSSTVTVLASRDPCRAEWRADPVWSEALRVTTLRNLAVDDVRAYLRRREVPTNRHATVLRHTYGHPLALALLTDALLREPDLDLEELPGDVVPALLARVVADAPTSAHRHGLEVTAIARSTDEGLLRQVLADPSAAHEVFAWLSELSVIDRCGNGLVPHDLVRALLDADLRWRDAEGYRRVFRDVQAWVMSQIRATTGVAQQRAIADLKFCFRNLRSVLLPLALPSLGDHYPDGARPTEHRAIIDMIGSAEGETSAATARHWLERQPEAFHVLRGHDSRARGVIALIDLTAATGADRRRDPGAAAAWNYADRTAPPRPGEVMTQCRFIVDAMAYQDPSPTLNAVPILTLQRQLTTPGLAWDFVTLSEPDRWDQFFAAADMGRATGADFHCNGVRFGLFGHDFRQTPVEAMIRRWTERALADDAFLVPVDTQSELLVLAYDDFDAAVRQGLRDLHRPDLLARNPLMRSRLLAGPRVADADAVASVLRAAVASLATDPREDRLFRALDCTFVRSARTQEAAAAAALDLPFSTYRRHLRRGIDVVVSRLWSAELGSVDTDRGALRGEK
ncbi:ATP-binding protein [Nocardioides sp. zg-1230]|uniref:ATP-binding protein n=1 Tax=Nocardioides sp. zg-1230 TaxID=2736601 RepID=UPI001C131AD1|nr:ATP-binding protein [Nocardioides sp. zg-1230]